MGRRLHKPQHLHNNVVYVQELTLISTLISATCNYYCKLLKPPTHGTRLIIINNILLPHYKAGVHYTAYPPRGVSLVMCMIFPGRKRGILSRICMSSFPVTRSLLLAAFTPATSSYMFSTSSYISSCNQVECRLVHTMSAYTCKHIMAYMYCITTPQHTGFLYFVLHYR